MEFTTEAEKYELYVQTTPYSSFTSGYGFVYSDRSVGVKPENDFTLPIFLKKTYNYYEYVDVKQDDTIVPIERQNINPFFIELSFFENVDSVGVISGSQLTTLMISFIRTRRPDVSAMTDTNIRNWFDITGYYELPWNKGSNTETTISEIENIDPIPSTIRGKANIYNITINK